MKEGSDYLAALAYRNGAAAAKRLCMARRLWIAPASLGTRSAFHAAARHQVDPARRQVDRSECLIGTLTNVSAIEQRLEEVRAQTGHVLGAR
jgi:hypothetical protein